MGDLTKNFSRSEFACNGVTCCGHSSPVCLKLVECVQKLRDIVGVPLHINSGFRCKTHNAKIGGKSESYHCLGMAADIAVPKNLTPQEFAKFAESVPEFNQGGIGIYTSWIHVDIRTTGKARWIN